MKAVIVDDENKAIQSIQLLLERYFKEIEVVATANSALEGIKAVNQHKPDILFTDIEMPHGSGFDLIEGIGDHKPEIVFVTAYNQYAIKAIKYSAFDYLLKPLDLDGFEETVKRIIEKIKSNPVTNYDILKENIKGTSPKLIAIASNEGIEYVPIENIIHLEAQGSYCKLFIENEAPLLTSKTLKEIEETIDSELFFRTHNSHVINLKKVKRYVKTDGGYIEMIDGEHIPISRRKKDLFLDKMQGTTT